VNGMWARSTRHQGTLAFHLTVPIQTPSGETEALLVDFVLDPFDVGALLVGDGCALAKANIPDEVLEALKGQLVKS